MIMSRAAMLAARSLTRSRTVMKNGFSSDDLGEKKGSFSCVAVEVSVHASCRSLKTRPTSVA